MPGSETAHNSDGEYRSKYNHYNLPIRRDANVDSGIEALKIDTSVALSPQIQAVSMLPTPLLPSFPSSAFPDDRTKTSCSNQRTSSASMVPDTVSSFQGHPSPRLHQNLMSPTIQNRNDESRFSVHSPILEGSPAPATSTLHTPSPLSRGNSLLIPKRGDRAKVQLSRSISVGGPQRQPSTVLHREPKAPISVVEELPEEVYVATNQSGAQTAWSRIKSVGKGSFSEVVLSKPSLEFVKPEYVKEIEAIANRELNELENEDSRNDDVPTRDTSASEIEAPSVLVAVKITTLNCNKPEAQLEFFKRDLDIMSSMPKHPSLMRMIGSSLDPKRHKRAIFVLPFCPGGDLFDLIAKHRSKLSSLLIRRLFADVCSAVVFLHGSLIVHRDIKLENVLIDVPIRRLLSMKRPDLYKGPLAVLTDLGLARRIDPEEPLLTTRCGSDDYVPPEIMLGQPYDGRETDSWALGVLLYAMLEGRLPFDAPPHAAQHEGSRARLKTAHRIARVDWNWFKRKEDADDDWAGGKQIVDACLKRRTNRTLASDILRMPWVSEAKPSEVLDSHFTDDLWKIFVQ